MSFKDLDSNNYKTTNSCDCTFQTFSGRNSTSESRAHGSRNESRKSHSRNLQTVTPHGTLKTSYTRAPTPKEEDLESVLDISGVVYLFLARSSVDHC